MGLGLGVPDELARLLASADAEPDDHRRALAMRKVLDQIEKRPPTEREACIQPLGKMLRDRDAFVRALAVTALSRIGTGAAQQALRPALDDPSAEIRAAALSGLGLGLGSAGSEPLDELAIPRLEPLLASTSPEAKAAALHALRRIAERATGPVALPEAAIERAAGDADRFVRAAAARTGAWLPTRTRAQARVLAGLGDDEPWVRESAARGAAEAFGIRDKGAQQPLCDALAFAREDATRLQLLRALAQLAAIPSPEDRTLVGLARAFLGAADPGVRAAALMLIGVAASEAAAPLGRDLGARLADDRPEIRAAAARLLGDLAPAGADELVSLLEAAVPCLEPAGRCALAMALRRIGTARTIPVLRKLAEDPELQVAKAAAEGLSVSLGE